jgi:hypothetical protein
MPRLSTAQATNSKEEVREASQTISVGLKRWFQKFADAVMAKE